MASLDLARADEPRAAVVVLHPHPDMGGDRFHPIVETIFQRSPLVGVAAARFDFVSSDPGVALGQAVDAVDALVEAVPSVPVFVAGYSFGALVAANMTEDRIAGWYLVAPPLASPEVSLAPIAADGRPKRVVLGERDPFSSPDRLADLALLWTATSMVVVSGADHFFVRATNDVGDDWVEWIETEIDQTRDD